MLKAKTFVKEVPRNSGLGRIYSYRYGGKKDKKVSDLSVAMNDPFFKEELAPKREVRRARFRPIPESDKDPIMPQKKSSGLSYPKVRVIGGSGTRNIPNRPLSEAKTPWLDKKPKGTSGSFAFKGDYGFDVPQLKTSINQETEYRNPFPRPDDMSPQKVNMDDYLNVVPEGVTRGELGLKKKSYKSPLGDAPMPYSNEQQEQLRKSDVQIGGGAKRAGSLAAIAGIGFLGPMLLRGLGKGKAPQLKQIPYNPKTQIPKGKVTVLPPKGGPMVPKSTVRYNPPRTRIGVNKSITNQQPYNQQYVKGGPKTPKSPRNATRMTRKNAKDLYKNYNPRNKYDGKIVKTPPSVLRRFMNRK